jgi:hypothetical protein
MSIDDIESILDNIRQNSVILSAHHKKRHYYLKEKIKWFRLPTIVLSALNSVFSVGLQPYMEQKTISITNCLISLVCGIIVSIEMFLSIESGMRAEQDATKEYYLLSVEIQKYLLLVRENRQIEPQPFLEKCYNQYVKLYENSGLVKKQIHDTLTPLEDKMKVGLPTVKETPSSGNSSLNSNFSIDNFITPV